MLSYMTVTQLKKLNQKNGGCFFNPRTMHFFRDTMDNFGARESETPDVVVLYRKTMREGQLVKEWLFSATTGRVLHN